MNLKPIGEILKEACKIEKDSDKIQFLRDNCRQEAIQYLLWLWVTDDVKFLLPEGDPPFETNPELGTAQVLYSYSKSLINVTNHGRLKYDKLRRENWFIGFLRDMHPTDAKLVCFIKDRFYPEGISKEIILKAFPNIENRFSP